MLEYRRVLIDWHLVEVSEPGQRLIDTVVASPRLVRRPVVRRRDAVTVALHQAVLLPSALHSRAC
jgi:hypothetical protein